MKQYFIAICIVLLALSCSDDSGKGSLPTPLDPPAEATLTLMIPGFRSASETRAGVHEEQIDEIDVLLFRKVSGTERVAAMLTVPATSLHGTGTPGEAKLSVSIPAGEYSRLALVANAHTELTAAGITAGTSGTPGSSYTDLRNVQTSGRYGNLGFGPDKTIAMYGEYAPTGGIQIEAGVPKVFPGTVGLIRSMARVDFVNQETSPDFVIDRIDFVNVAGHGTVYVDPAVYGVDAGAGGGGSGYLSPTLPASGLGSAPGSQNATSLVFIDWSSPHHTYYLYEQPISGAPALVYDNITRARIVLWSKYKGRKTWYPIDFTWDGVKGGGTAPYTKGTPMPILRNHRYVFTIKEVKGPGYGSREEAVNTSEILTNSNITVQTHVIDEAYTDVAFNEQGFLAVSRTAMTLKGKKTAASTDNKVEVLTNVAEGFRVWPFNDDGTPISIVGGWLRPSTASGAANANTTVQAITNGVGKYKGYLEVRAGRLYTKVNVEQIWKLPLEYVAEYNLAGGAQYGSSFSNSSPPGAVPTAAQTDLQLRWATNHANDQSGYYNWYVLKGVTESTYNPAGKNLFNDAFFTTGTGKGYHLPSLPELVGVFSFNGQIQFSTNAFIPPLNEAIEFGGVKKTYLNEYRCTGANVCYCLRFQPGTGNPAGGFPLSEFPKATDNSMLCAYRYTCMGTFAYDNNLTSQLKVDCVYLGESGASLRVIDISDDAWWAARASETVTRIFPVAGLISGTSLNVRGFNAFYFSDKENGGNTAWCAFFGQSQVSGSNYVGMENGLSVRLFTRE
ncbi:Mfa1 fimbrilin C-terminal domain-containing protein [Bacteroides pyogenes]|uniref:Mfa1 fimbrilin C-terminal domain-containing protein n=1 Tax=Bacteroides pyogenes TaxID=310300 RepID=UPI001F38777F|nr:Mfa1 fimbrilin C-terminal domain-containing protein [Bacteroides pyogenes]